MSTQNAGGAAQASSLIDTLLGSDRAVITASLELANGRFLQPTGFPDIGACIYRDKDGRRWCLVESEQSMANRLEAVCMKDPGIWVEELKGLPVVAVYDPDGDLLTTSLCEPHRIASSYILQGKIGDTMTLHGIFERRLGLKGGGNSWPMGKRADLEKLVFALDPGAMLHGFQFVQWKFVGLRQTRVLHARLEAGLAEEPEVHYGMVKWDAIEPESTREERANKGQSIAAKSRIVPAEISAWFEIDLLGLKNLTLAEDWKRFLLGLALWKVGAFLANRPAYDPRSRQTLPSLRLRADCYLRLGSEKVKWEGDSVSGETTPVDLMGALESVRAAQPDFEKLVAELLGSDGSGGGEQESSHSSDKSRKLYGGPLVEVTYEPKNKPAAAGQPSEPQEGEPEPEEDLE